MTKSLEVTIAVPRERPPAGKNGAILKLALAEERIRGNSGDYAILDGGRLVTSFGSYSVRSRSTGDVVDVTNVDGDGEVDPNRERIVIHRRNLWRHVGVEEARKFWKFGRRTRR